MTSISKSLVLAAVTLGLAVPAAAAAQTVPVKKAIAQVQTGDLDLASVEGQATLVKRIESASRSVCAINMFGQPAGRSEKTKCSAATTAALKAHFKIGA